MANVQFIDYGKVKTLTDLEWKALMKKAAIEEIKQQPFFRGLSDEKERE